MKEKIITYWAGYYSVEPVPLDRISTIPHTVNLAFGCTGKKPSPTEKATKMTMDFLCSIFKENDVIEWVKYLQDVNGQKVFLSILDDPGTPWSDTDLDKITDNILDYVANWNLDGIDVDAESGMPDDVYVENFVNLIKLLREKLPPEVEISYTCYTSSDEDKQILTQTKGMINYINTMDYYNTPKGHEQTFDFYAQFVGKENVYIGVKSNFQSTSLETVKELCKFEPAGGTKGGMMLWTINGDIQSHTGHPTHTWINTIKDNLNCKPELNERISVEDKASVMLTKFDDVKAAASKAIRIDDGFCMIDGSFVEEVQSEKVKAKVEPGSCKIM